MGDRHKTPDEHTVSKAVFTMLVWRLGFCRAEGRRGWRQARSGKRQELEQLRKLSQSFQGALCQARCLMDPPSAALSSAKCSTAPALTGPSSYVPCVRPWLRRPPIVQNLSITLNSSTAPSSYSTSSGHISLKCLLLWSHDCSLSWGPHHCWPGFP